MAADRRHTADAESPLPAKRSWWLFSCLPCKRSWWSFSCRSNTHANQIWLYRTWPGWPAANRI